jgi:predicted nucleotidyltransferase
LTSWYNSCMPRIKDVKPLLPEITEGLSKINGVKNIYVWGSFAENFKNPNFRIKDLDIIVLTKFNSGDLISVNNEILQAQKTDNLLVEDGFNPEVVKFSRDFLSFNKYSIDRWAISSDKALLHWGPIPTNKEEADDFKKEAENHAFFITGINKTKLNTIADDARQNWYNSYYEYVLKFFSNMPSGWYKSEDQLSNILKNSIKLK